MGLQVLEELGQTTLYIHHTLIRYWLFPSDSSYVSYYVDFCVRGLALPATPDVAAFCVFPSLCGRTLC